MKGTKVRCHCYDADPHESDYDVKYNREFLVITLVVSALLLCLFS